MVFKNLKIIQITFYNILNYYYFMKTTSALKVFENLELKVVL
jgi:hypothetical protein